MKKQTQLICPWCGGENFERKNGTGHSKWCFKCLDCNRYFRLYYGYMIWPCLYCILLLLTAYGLFDSSLAIILAWIMAVPYALTVAKMPMKRVSMGEKYYVYYPEQYLGMAQIIWYKYSEGGLRFPHITIWNHYILPICFINEQGIPISQVGYARINKIYLKKERRIMQVTENYKYNPTEMKEFVIFYNRRIIARGKMI